MLNFPDIPPSARVERIVLLGEAIEHELAELWHQCEAMTRAIAPTTHIPTAAIDGDLLRLSSRPIELVRQPCETDIAA